MEAGERAMIWFAVLIAVGAAVIAGLDDPQLPPAPDTLEMCHARKEVISIYADCLMAPSCVVDADQYIDYRTTVDKFQKECLRP